MSKIGRNTPCPCASGKKYKHCCLQIDEAAATARRLEDQHPANCQDCGKHATPEDRELTDRSDAILELIRRSRLDDAERATHDLIAKFPDALEGPDLLGLICRQRGDRKQAAAYFRQAAAIMRTRSGYSIEDRLAMIMNANELDPPDPSADHS